LQRLRLGAVGGGALQAPGQARPDGLRGREAHPSHPFLRANLPAAKYNEHRELEGWKLDKPVQFKNNSNQFVYKVIEFGTFDKKPKWVKHGIQEWQDGTYY